VIGTEAFNVFEFDWYTGTMTMTIATVTVAGFVKMLAARPSESTIT
jgi:hypothetical protein